MLQQSTAYTDDDVYISGLVVEFGDTEKQEHVCVQDMFSSRLLTMTITEFLVPKLSYLGTAAAKRALRDRGVTHWLGRKDPFQLEKNVTHLIYFQSLLWLLQPMYPLAAVLGPLLLVADFKFDKAYLIRCSSKSAPFAGSQTLFLLFNVLSLAVFALFWGFLWAFDPSVTECVPAAGVYEGPFQPDTSGASGYAQTSPSRDFTARGAGLATVVDVVFHPTVLFMGMVLLRLLGKIGGFKVTALQEYAEEKHQTLQQQVYSLQAQSRNKERQLATLKKQAHALKDSLVGSSSDLLAAAQQQAGAGVRLSG